MRPALLILNVNHVCLWDSLINVHLPFLIVLFECEEEACLRGNQVDPVDMIIDLIKSHLSEDLDSSELRPYQVRAPLALLSYVSLIIFMSYGIFFIAFDAHFLWQSS